MRLLPRLLNALEYPDNNNPPRLVCGGLIKDNMPKCHCHTNPSFTLVTEQVIVGHASGYGYNNAVEGTRFATVTNTGVGQYTVVFDADHPDGANYEVVFGAEEDAARDVPKVSVVRGSKAATGFDFIVTGDDNGGTADTFDPAGWSFNVLKTVSIVTGVSDEQNIVIS